MVPNGFRLGSHRTYVYPAISKVESIVVVVVVVAVLVVIVVDVVAVVAVAVEDRTHATS